MRDEGQSFAERRRRKRVSASRRRMLLGLASLAAIGADVTAQTVPAPLYDPARFQTLSRLLTGYAQQDPVATREMVGALRDAVGNDALRRIATLAAVTPAAQLADELRIAGLTRQATLVITALYTGIVDTPKGPRVLTYDNALVWQALPWTKPNAYCGGSTNYWTDPPPGMPA